MKATELLSDELTAAPRQSGYELNIVGVYQDPLTQSWGLPMCRLATDLVGEDLVHNTWYDVHSLSDLGILLPAVRAALVADVIVVSVYAADELPLDLYVWINAWLPRRNSREGAFTALIGAEKPQDSQSVRTLKYSLKRAGHHCSVRPPTTKLTNPWPRNTTEWENQKTYSAFRGLLRVTHFWVECSTLYLIIICNRCWIWFS